MGCKQIALLGGAFNPITKGHTDIIDHIKNKIDQDIWIMPAYSHTFHKTMLDCSHRIEMCKIAAPKTKIFDYEVFHKLTGGTLNIYNHLKNDKLYKDYDFSWVIGMDNANNIDKWVNYEELIQTVKFIVIPRNGTTIDETQKWYKNPPHMFLDWANDIMEISSTEVRNMLNEYYENNSNDVLVKLKKYVDPKVLKYIFKNRLYEDTKRNDKSNL